VMMWKPSFRAWDVLGQKQLHRQISIRIQGFLSHCE
jgi:hypothetical protein